MDMIYCLTYIYFQHQSSLNHFLVVSNIVLLFLLDGFLTVIFILQFLSLMTIWTIVAQMIPKKGINGYK